MKGWIGMNLDDEVRCCIQHLGAMQGGIADDALRARVHGVLVKAARRKNMPCAPCRGAGGVGGLLAVSMSGSVLLPLLRQHRQRDEVRR